MRGTAHLGPERRGGVYIAVLGAATLISVVGLAAVMTMRAQGLVTRASSDAAKARLYALAGIELGLRAIDTDPSWRTTQINGNWVATKAIGDGTISVDGVDPIDGVLSDSDLDPVELTSTGTKGGACHIVKVRVQAAAQTLSCLAVPMASGLGQTHNSATLTSDGPVSSNLTFTALTSTITADIEAVGLISGATYNGKTTILAAPRQMPDAAAFDSYIAAGTTINWASIPTDAGVTTIDRTLLSAATNPMGSTNAQGIYIINCADRKIVIKDSRIVGTLVLLDPGAGSTIQGSVLMENAAPNYPCLLVRGNLSVALSASDLTENSGGTNVNFNPVGTPYLGVTDSDKSDSYPPGITGLVYISKDAGLGGTTPINGALVVGGSVVNVGAVTLKYTPAYFTNPPPGFYSPPKLRIASNGWVQVIK